MKLHRDAFLRKVLHIVVSRKVVSVDEVRVLLVGVPAARAGGSNLITLESVMAREAHAGEARAVQGSVNFGCVVRHCSLLRYIRTSSLNAFHVFHQCPFLNSLIR